MANPDDQKNKAADGAQENPELKLIKVDDYEFYCDVDLMDDIEALDTIHQIEDKGRVSAIVPLLHFLLSDEEFNKLHAHFVKADAKEHENVKDYRPRFRASKLSAVYNAIIAQFNPKG